jgi:hypothetical protein
VTQESVRDLVEDLLRTAHQSTSFGRWMESSPSGPATDSEIPDAFPDLLEFLTREARTLEAIVVRLASEVDSLRAT